MQVRGSALTKLVMFKYIDKTKLIILNPTWWGRYSNVFFSMKPNIF